MAIRFGVIAAVLLSSAALLRLDAAPAEELSVAPALRPYVRTLARPVYTYHYTTRARVRSSALGAPTTDSAALRTYLVQKLNRYWDLSLAPERYAMVSAFYVAADPVASRVHGGVGDIWTLVQVVLQPGFRFVDARRPEDGDVATYGFEPHVREKLAAAGCTAPYPDSLLTALGSRRCREIAHRTLRDLDVDAIAYAYTTTKFRTCGARPETAFILLRADGLDSRRTKVLTTDSAGDASATRDRLLIHKLFERARQVNVLHRPLWTDLERSAPNLDLDLDAWMRDHLFGCGDHVEDKESPHRMGAAIEHWTGAVRTAPESAPARYALAAALAADGRSAEAVRAYEQTLELNPNHAEALRELAWLRATSDDPMVRNPATAVPLAQRLVELTQYRWRERTGGVDWARSYKVRGSLTLAAAYAAAGEFDRAIGYAHQAYETATQQDAEYPTPLTAHTVSQALNQLALYRAGRPYVEPRHASSAGLVDRPASRQ